MAIDLLLQMREYFFLGVGHGGLAVSGPMETGERKGLAT
jgi:hypothetical protein